MSWVFAVAIFFVIWWIVLFAVLPFGVRTQEEADDIVPGTPESAPARPALLRVFGITTVVALLVFGFVYWVITTPASKGYIDVFFETVFGMRIFSA